MSRWSSPPVLAPLTPTLKAYETIRAALLRAQKKIPVDDFEHHATLREAIDNINGLMINLATSDDPNSELNAALRASNYLAEMGQRVQRLESSVSGLLGRDVV